MATRSFTSVGSVSAPRMLVGADGGTGYLAPALPAYATAIGKALLAFSPSSVVNRVIADGMQTANAMNSPDNLRQALSVIRLTQIATARDEHHVDRSAIAMPVFAGGGRVAAAVELTVREPGTDLKAVTGALTVACRSLSRQLATEFRDRGTVRYNGKWINALGMSATPNRLNCGSFRAV